MRRLTFVIPVVFVFILGTIGLAFAAASASSSSQNGEATVEIIAEPTESPSETGSVNMVLYRLVVPPGVAVEAHDHYDAAIWYIDAGSIALTIDAGEVWVRQCDGECLPSDTPTDGTFQHVGPGSQVELDAGDWVIQHDTITHAYENTGETDAVILASATYFEPEFDGTPVAMPDPGGTPAAMAGPGPRPRGCVGGCK